MSAAALGRLLAIRRDSDVGSFRRAGLEAAHRLGLDEAQCARAALVATELASNIQRHAGAGWAVAQVQGDSLRLIAVDHGPGIPDLPAAMADGGSTRSGGLGSGLGAVKRAASSLEIDSEPGRGTCVQAVLGAPPNPHSAHLLVPMQGERETGDGLCLREDENRRLLLVIDALGHGNRASADARAAEQAFRRTEGWEPAEILRAIHQSLRGRRGVVALAILMDEQVGQLSYCGVGNIHGVCVDGRQRAAFASRGGVLGYNAEIPPPQKLAWAPGALLLAHSDGLSARWSAEPWSRWSSGDPGLLCARLLRDQYRDRDDSVIVAIRHRRNA